MLGAARVIAIDRLPERLEMARSIGAITVDYSAEDVSVLTALKDLTGGIGPDSCIDAVGLEAHSAELQGIYDKVKTALRLETDRPSVLRQAIQAVRKRRHCLRRIVGQSSIWSGSDQYAQLHQACSSALRSGRSIPVTLFRTASLSSRLPRCTRFGATRRKMSPKS